MKWIVLLVSFLLVGEALAMPLLAAPDVAGISTGVLFVLGDPLTLICVLIAGVWAVRLGGEALIMFPFGFLMFYLLGAATDANAMQSPVIRAIIFACVLLLVGASGAAYRKAFFISLCVSALPAFLLGARMMHPLLSATNVEFSLIGAASCVTLLLACVVAGVITGYGFIQMMRGRNTYKKNFPSSALPYK